MARQGWRRWFAALSPAAALALVGLTALAGLAGCSDGSSSGAATMATPLPVTAGFKQYRRDAARRLVQVSITNTGTSPLQVDAVRLDTSAYGPAGEARPDAQLRPGETTDFPVPYGPARCEDGATARPPGAVISVRGVDGAVGSQSVAFTSGLEQFAQVHEFECATAAVAATVKLDWAPSWSPGDRPDSLRGALRVRRIGAGGPGPAVRVDQLAGSVILTVWTVPDLRPAAVLEPGKQQVEVPVEIVPTRCDGHARADSSKTFVFSVWVALDDGPVLATSVTATGETLRQLQAQIDRVCGV